MSAKQKHIPRVNPTHGWKQDIVDRYFKGTPIELTDVLNQSPLCHDKTVVHIAARSGSTRLPDKNIKPLCGIPLMAYSILIAREMGADRVIMNTDSIQYAKIAEKYGAEVPFIRPRELSSDTASPGLASYYAQQYLLREGYPLDTWIELYPTSPFRNVKTMRDNYKSLRMSGTFATVSLPRNPFKGLYSHDMTPITKNTDAYENSTVFYKRTGSMLGYKLNLNELRWRHCKIINDPIELIDIDTEKDFALAESIIESDAYDFGVPLC